MSYVFSINTDPKNAAEQATGHLAFYKYFNGGLTND